ncbi:hypothetical protein F4820DRAFT_143299 [Hypoxylon rubiginosum]|uniref:Uncharacterized protein n=1 Tax=Hypoxylon rubiginosum TaxID=110542 RepID=A0ACB9YJT0_9PEZI|nr:hypothetical protein F4820DRAFT_143299 [Hypoxylon rubiginosum]
MACHGMYLLDWPIYCLLLQRWIWPVLRLDFSSIPSSCPTYLDDMNGVGVGRYTTTVHGPLPSSDSLPVPSRCVVETSIIALYVGGFTSSPILSLHLSSDRRLSTYIPTYLRCLVTARYQISRSQSQSISSYPTRPSDYRSTTARPPPNSSRIPRQYRGPQSSPTTEELGYLSYLFTAETHDQSQQPLELCRTKAQTTAI